MTSKTNLGMEQEFLLIDNHGYVVNNADDILNDNDNREICVAEATHAQVEVNSSPADSITQLELDLQARYTALEKVCAKHQVVPLPASEFGAKNARSRSGKARYDIYELILGKENNDKTNTISGIHIHYSIIPGFEVEQYSLLQALDPLSYAISSTSPFRYDGVNSLNCHRVNLVRHDAFRDFPLHSKLQNYPTSMAELDSRNDKRFQEWQRASGLSSNEFSKFFTPENTGYAPIRKRPSIGATGTFEVRTCDTTPLDIALAISALYKGVLEASIDQRKISISNNDTYHLYPAIRLPHLKTLLSLERMAIKQGMGDSHIRSYAQQALFLAREGLPCDEHKYLQPIQEMIQTGENPATKLIKYLRESDQYAPQLTLPARAKANLFIRSLYKRSLNHDHECY